jgi:hypothetical protein
MSQTHNATPSTIQKLLKSPKIIIGFICILIILIIFTYSVVVLIIRRGKVAVTVTVAPYSAQLELNGMNIRNNHTIYLKKGHYHLVSSNEHFETTEADITISDNQHYIAAMLEPSDEEGQAFKDSHKRQFTNAEGALGLALNAEGKDYQEKYPIVKYLPINNRFYSISYQAGESGEPVVNIKTDLSYLDVAVAKLKTLKGVSIPDYEINFNIPNQFTISDETSSDVEALAKRSVTANNYSFSSGQYIANEYYLAIYTREDPESLMQNGKYLALFRKSGEDWQIVAKPQPVLTRANTPDTDTEILNSANSYAGQ